MFRTTRVWTLAFAILAAVSCEIPSRADLTGVEPTRIDVSPKNVLLQQYQVIDFTAVGLTSAGDTADVTISWSATSGTITDTSTSSGRHRGRYRAGSDTGKVKIVAKGRQGGPADTADVTITDAPVTTVGVSPAAASIAVGATVQLSATPQDLNGNPLPGRVVTWASTNPGVATVSSIGLVRGVAAGAATVTVSCEGQTGAAAITVAVVPVASVAVTPPSASVTVGQTVQLTATPKDANGNPLSGRTVTWATSNAAVATVSGTGLVSAVAVGSATLTATSEGRSGTATVTVSAVPVSSVTVTPASASVLAGQTVQLSATPKDANGNPLTGRVVTWATSSAAVATVNGSGLVTGVAAGTATLTATSEGKSGTATVTVTVVPVASVTVSPASPSVLAGQTVQLTASTTDANGNPLTGRVVTWATSNAAVATVNGSGRVTGVAAGSATITATSEGQSGTATVTVTAAPVVSVTVSPASASVAVGQTVQLSATPKDGSGSTLTGRVVTWATSNAAVATVNGSGLVAGVAVGSATITATSEGINGTAALTVTLVAQGCSTSCRYVAVNGNDNNAGTSTAPWRTIQHAADVLNPGDTAIVNDGVYTGGTNVVSINRSGTAAAWLVFRAANRWGAIVDGQNFNSSLGFAIGGNYIRVEGFEVRNTNRAGIEAYGGRDDIAGNHDITITQNHVHDIGHICTSSTGGMVGVNAYSDNMIIERNVIHDIGRLKPGEQGCNPTNTFWQTHDHGIYNGVGDNVVIRNNVFYNTSQGWAIQRYNGGGSVTSGLTIVNNTFAGSNPYRDAQIIIATPTNNIVIANNVFYQAATAGVLFEGAGPGGTLSGNVSTNAVQTGGSGLTMSGNLQSTDPRVVNAAGFDFHLTAGSPARGVGVAAWCPAVDFDGVVRTGACSAGAYQN